MPDWTQPGRVQPGEAAGNVVPFRGVPEVEAESLWGEPGCVACACAGLVQRGPGGRLVVTTNPSGQDAEALRLWRGLAEAAWHAPEHRNWVVVQEQLVRAQPRSSHWAQQLLSIPRCCSSLCARALPARSSWPPRCLVACAPHES